jgi:hypothetical protein
MPVFQSVFSEHPVKGVVDFRGVKFPGIKRQILPAGHYFRVKGTFPVIVMPPGGSAVDSKVYF